MPERDEIAQKLEVTLAPYDAERADVVYEALAEYLVAVWLARREESQPGAGEEALPDDEGIS